MRKASSTRGEAKVPSAKIVYCGRFPGIPPTGMPANRATMWVSFSTMEEEYSPGQQASILSFFDQIWAIKGSWVGQVVRSL